MSLQRRNTVTTRDAQIVAVVAVLSAVVAALADVAPTGHDAIDAVLTGGLAATVTWLAATAPWWALVTGAGLVVAGSITGPWWLAAVAGAALLGAAWIGWSGASLPIARAAIGAAVVQVALRIEWNPFFLSSASLTAVALGLIAITGLLRRHRDVRRRVYWTLGGLTVCTVLAVAGLGIAAYQARSSAQDGYNGMLDGLERVQSGDTAEASETLMQAAADLNTAREKLGGVFTQPVRLVPGVAQNRNSATEVIERASEAAATAADALALTDLDALTVSGGRISLAALADLEAPLADLEVAVADLRDTLHDAASPWLVGPFQDRLERVTARADQAARQAEATAETARVAPAMLGADEPRTYLLAFVNTAEARGQGGLMGNWSEVTVDDGRIRVTANGRSADLQTESLRDLELDVSDDYIVRYGNYGAARTDEDGVTPKYWSNVTMPADMPSVGSPMAQMYEQATGRAVDGVFVIDPIGLGALVDVIGSVDVKSLDRSFTGDELRDFLLLDQYEIEEAEREDVLEAITEITVTNLFSDDLPPPQALAAELSDAVLGGHITGWAQRPEEQRLLELAGMDGSLPTTATSGMDALAVVSNNASGNKIENFLERQIEYRAVVDERTGDVDATLTLTMTNTAPDRGFDDYVIGNIVDAPIGTNRMLLDVYSRLDVVDAQLDGVPQETFTTSELGYRVYRRLLDIPAGETVVFEITLQGNVGPGEFALAYRPQALPNPDTVSLAAETTDGDDVFGFDGEIERRSVVSASGVTAWWQPDTRSVSDGS